MRNLVFIALLVATIASGAKAETYAAELDQLAAKSDLNDLIKRVNQPRSVEEVRVGLNWLRAKSIESFGGSRIHYSYALGLFRANVKETATFAFLYGLLAGRIDASRCADPLAPGEKLQRWEQSLGPIFLHFLSLSLDERRKLVSMAIATEEQFSARAADTWLCSGGLVFMHKFMEKHKDDPSPPAREIQDGTRPGRTILLDDPAIKPEFVTDEEWNIKRKQLVSKFSEQLLAAK